MFRFALIFALALGCHGMSVPSEARTADVNTYMLYTKSSGESFVHLPAVAADIEAAIDDTLNTVFLVHGHRESGYTSLNPGVRRAILTVEEANVIVVDWQRYAANSYSSSVNNVPLIAESLANFITLLNGIATFTGKVHIVGFGLGAHVAGIAGRSLSSRIEKITGLDPSGSQWGTNSNRLRSTDAAYVEVIHTDGSGLFSNGLGVAIGQVDFFVNGGSNQPGCLTSTCCHERAYEVFEASFYNPTLRGQRCMTNAQMNLNRCSGDYLRLGTNDFTKTGTGVYRINTGRSFPF